MLKNIKRGIDSGHFPFRASHHIRFRTLTPTTTAIITSAKTKNACKNMCTEEDSHTHARLSPLSLSLSVYIYLSIYLSIYLHTYIYTHSHTQSLHIGTNSLSHKHTQGTTLNNLFSASDDMHFGPTTLFVYGCLYFIITALSVGTATPCGAFIPIVLVGASFGRLLGLLVRQIVNGNSSLCLKPCFIPACRKMRCSEQVLRGYWAAGLGYQADCH